MFINYIFLLALALLIALFFAYVLRIKGPWGSFWTFFVVILFTVVITNSWIEPIGPYIGTVYWFPPLTSGILIALLLAATTPNPRSREKLKNNRQGVSKTTPTEVALSAFFWIVLILMLVLIIAGNFNYV